MAKNSIFITGAAQGIGRATAIKFAQQGWFVGAYDVNQQGLDDLAAELEPNNSICAQLDVCDPAQFEQRLQEFASATSNTLTVLFNNAGILQMSRFEDNSLVHHHRTIDVNIKGVVNGIYAALPLLKNAHQPCILSMGSASGVYGTPDHSVYSASKFAVRALTEALSVELAQYHIRVCDLMPAFVATDMVLAQQNPSQLVAQMGVVHNAEDIAQQAWDMVHSNKIHGMTWQVRLLDFVSGLAPGIIRRGMISAINK